MTLCFRSPLDCNAARRHSIAKKRLRTGKCRRYKRAYCIQVRDNMVEEVRYSCTADLADCQRGARNPKAIRMIDVLKDCHERE